MHQIIEVKLWLVKLTKACFCQETETKGNCATFSHSAVVFFRFTVFILFLKNWEKNLYPTFSGNSKSTSHNSYFSLRIHFFSHHRISKTYINNIWNWIDSFYEHSFLSKEHTWAKLLMPTVPTFPSTRTHSCLSVNFRAGKQEAFIKVIHLKIKYIVCSLTVLF